MPRRRALDLAKIWASKAPIIRVSVSSWLSLALAGRPAGLTDSKRNPVRILVPKKVAKLATRRNRIRRLIKEALRLHFSLDKDKVYTFRVVRDPGDIGLTQTKETIRGLWTAR